MKKILLVLFCVIEINMHAQNGNGIIFEDYTKVSFEDVLAKAKALNKPVFVDIWTTWCGPCKQLKDQTFVLQEVGEFFNENFLNLNFDGENPDWVDVTEKYFATAFPTILFLTPDGEVILNGSNLQIGMLTGGIPNSAARLIEQGELVLDYLQRHPDSNFLTTRNLERIKTYNNSSNSKIFELVIDAPNPEILDYAAKVLNQESVNIYRKASTGYILNKTKFESIKRNAEKLNTKDRDKIIFSLNSRVCYMEKDWHRYYSLFEEALLNEVVPDYWVMYIANDFMGCNDKILLNKILERIDYVISNTPENSRNLQSYKDTREKIRLLLMFRSSVKS